MSVSKVILNGTTLMDVTQDTVATGNLLSGYTAHGADGSAVTGSYVPQVALEEKDVNFYDYDGTLLYSYTVSEFANLADLPANPTHERLTAQGWNWTKAQITAQLSGLPGVPVIVGQMYTPTSEATEIDITLEAPDLTPYLRLVVGDGNVVVDWGDGSTPETLSYDPELSGQNRYFPHTYAAGGDYTISVKATGSSPVSFKGAIGDGFLLSDGEASMSQKYVKCVKRIFVYTASTFGYRSAIYSGAFDYCPDLETITLAKDNYTSSIYPAWEYCPSLKFLVIPPYAIAGEYGLPSNLFANCPQLKKVSLPGGTSDFSSSCFFNDTSLDSITIPYNSTNINASVFSGCGLEKVKLPNSVTVLSSSAFSNCKRLKNINIGNSVTTISASAFRDDIALTEITLPSTVTSIGTYAFYGCKSLLSINIPSGVTTINTYTFHSCFSLPGVEIPNTVTKIDQYAFYNCLRLKSITVPASVTTINAYAFAFDSAYASSQYRARAEYHMLRTTPPTLANKNAFNNAVSGTVIYVPYSADHSILNAYKTASNWSNYASYMEEEPQT